MPSTACLTSIVKNTSGVKKFFAFLPPHGQWLDVNQEISYFGSILERVRKPNRYSSKTETESLDAALLDGSLEIRQLPVPVLVQSDTGNTVALDSHSLNGVTAVTPCWNQP